MHGHFRSRDKDGGHTILSAGVEKPTLHAKSQTPWFSVINRSYGRCKLRSPITPVL